MPISFEQQIQQYQRQLKQKQENAAELRGQKAQLIKQLEAEGCKDIAEAELQIKEEQEKIEYLQAELEAGIKRLEEEYQWD